MDSKRRPFPIKDKFNVAIPNANVLETLNEFNDTIAEFNSVFSLNLITYSIYVHRREGHSQYSIKTKN